MVITGAAGGIGKCLTLQCLNLGAHVWGLDRNQKDLAALEDAASKEGHSFSALAVDIANPTQMKEAITKISGQAKPIFLWINNAGISGKGDFMRQSFEEYETTLRINLGGVVLGTRLAIEKMEQQGKGIIVNIASVAGHISCPYLTSYSASKHAVVGFTRALRQELQLKDSPVKLVLASPGFVDTSMIERGQKGGLPNWMAPFISTPEKVAKEILAGLNRKQLEIFPTLNGKLMLRFHRFIPRRLLLTSNVKDLFLFRLREPS